MVSPGIAEDFGTNVAISGDTIYAGAFLDDQHGGNAAGAVYKWQLSTGAYLGELAAPNPHQAAYFGYSIAATDRWIAVGAAIDDPAGGGFGAGGAHLYDAATGAYVRSMYNPEPSP